MTERGKPLSGATQGPRQVEEKRPVPKRSKHVLFMKKLLNMIERVHPLLAVTQVTSQATTNQCWTRWTLTSEYLDCHILLWSMRRAQAFENWFGKLRNTFTDMLFNAIYNKTKPFTRSVRRQSKWFRTWTTCNCLNCSRRTLRRSAKNACHTGVNASSIAHAGISWKKLWWIEISLNFHWTFFQFQNT